MINFFAWLFDKRVRDLDEQLADKIFENEQLTEQINRLNNELYKTTCAYQEINRKLEIKMKQNSELKEQLAEQKQKTARYVDLYLDATKEKYS